MKKILWLSLSSILAMTILSCSTTGEELDNQKNSENWDHIDLPIIDSSKSLGKYNALGYGYNVLGEYANENFTTLPIIDTDKFINEFPDRLSEENVKSQQNENEYGEDAAAYSEVISSKILTIYPLRVFGKTIPFSSAIRNNKKYDPSYIYGSYSYLIKQKRFRFNATSQLFYNFLTESFLEDLKKMTAAEIVEKYGTHVATDVYTGAILDVIFQAKTTNPDRERAARLGVKKYTDEMDAIDASKNYEKRLFYKTRGGNKKLAMSGIYNLDRVTPTIKFSEWQSTINNENAVLVDFGERGLMPIYDLVKDTVKKSQLKDYIDQYLQKNQVFLDS